MKTKFLERVELLGHGLAFIAMLCYSFKVCTQVTGPLVLIVAVGMLIVSVIGYIKSKKRCRMFQNKKRPGVARKAPSTSNVPYEKSFLFPSRIFFSKV